MKNILLTASRLSAFVFASLILTVLSAAILRAQVTPHLDCVEPVLQNNVPTGALRAWFGYTNAGGQVVLNEGPNNYFAPNPEGALSGTQTTTFQPGFVKRSFSIVFNAAGNSSGAVTSTQVIWFVQNRPALTSAAWAAFCGSGTINYQGRLSVSGAAANSPHDFQFVFWNQETGGTPSAEVFELQDVPVSNGVFSVNLDTEFVFKNYTGSAGFLEIRVRRANTSDAYTALSPRQRLTAAPFAINAKNVLGGRVQLSYDRTATCDKPSDYGILRLGGITGEVQLCTANGWRSITLQ